MKSLILKDLYNLRRNARSMALVLVFLAVCQIPSIGGEGFLASTVILCSMLVVTSFSFDEHYDWNRYALIMPLSRRDLVGAKYLLLAIVTGLGAAAGLVLGLAGTAVLGGDCLGAAPDLLGMALVAFSCGLMIGGMVIPLILRFGAEKGWLLMILSAAVPTGLILGGAKLLSLLGVAVTPAVLLAGAPALALLWCGGMYRISCRIFEKQEL